MSQPQQDDFEPQFLEDLRKERREKLFENQTLALLALIAVLITAIGITTVALIQRQRQRARYNALENGLRTEASVVSREGKKYSYTFEYLGKTYDGSGKPDREHRQQADETGTLDVYFLPEHPENSRPVHEPPPIEHIELLARSLARILTITIATFIILLVYLASGYFKARRDARRCLRVIETLTEGDYPVSPRALLEQAEKQGAKKKWLADMREFLMTGCEPISGPQCLWIDSISKWQERWEGGADTRELLRRYAFALRFIYRIRGELRPVPQPGPLPRKIPYDDVAEYSILEPIRRLAHLTLLDLVEPDEEGGYRIDRTRLNIEKLREIPFDRAIRIPGVPRIRKDTVGDIWHRLRRGHWPEEEPASDEAVDIEDLFHSLFGGKQCIRLEHESNGEPVEAEQFPPRIERNVVHSILYLCYCSPWGREPETREIIVETHDRREAGVRIRYVPDVEILLERLTGSPQ